MKLSMSGSEEGVFWQKGPFKNVHLPEVIKHFEILKTPGSPRVWETKENPIIF